MCKLKHAVAASLEVFPFFVTLFNSLNIIRNDMYLNFTCVYRKTSRVLWFFFPILSNNSTKTWQIQGVEASWTQNTVYMPTKPVWKVNLRSLITKSYWILIQYWSSTVLIQYRSVLPLSLTTRLIHYVKSERDSRQSYFTDFSSLSQEERNVSSQDWGDQSGELQGWFAGVLQDPRKWIHTMRVKINKCPPPSIFPL